MSLEVVYQIDTARMERAAATAGQEGQIHMSLSDWRSS